MRFFTRLLIIAAGLSLFLASAGRGSIEARNETLAQEIDEFKSQTKAQMHSNAARKGMSAVKNVNVPEIVFEKLKHDYGIINVSSYKDGEFKFTNKGDGILKIGKIHSTCGCTVPRLKKRIYKPGESGTIKVTYSAGTFEGLVNKTVYVTTNDPNNRRVPLKIVGKIVQKVVVKPESLNLLLNKKNAGCPDIVLTSTDKKEFSVRGVKSDFKGIKIDFDPKKRGKKIVLKPIVDMNELKETSYGKIDIQLTHPECRQVDVRFNVLPRFKLEPQYITMLKSQPGVKVKKDLWVLNNYNEDFEIVSAKSENAQQLAKSGKGDKQIVKVLSKKKIGHRYKLELELTPPTDNKQIMFLDKLIIKTNQGDTLTVHCSGFFTVKERP